MKAVIFDLGHTLIDYYSDWRIPENGAVSKFYGIISRNSEDPPEESEFIDTMILELEKARYRRRTEMIEIPLENFLHDRLVQFGVPPNDEVIIGGLEVFYQALLEHRKLIPGTVEMLQDMKDGGYLIGLISDVAWGLPSYFPMRDITFYGLDQFFDDLVFSSDVGLRKPNPRIFRIALDNLGVTATESAYVGNNLQADIKGALEVGLKAILKKSNYFFPDESIVPHARVDEWSELRGVLEGL